MRRREFVTAVGGLATWPLVARAQQPVTNTPVVMLINARRADAATVLTAEFRKGLSQTGLTEGKDVAVEYHWLDGHYENLPAIIGDAVRRHVAVIATPASTPSSLAAKAATRTIPVIFLSSANPVEIGLVASLNRPGGNITGVTTLNTELAPKRLELLRQLAPNANHCFALINPASDLAAAFTKDISAAAATLGIGIDILRASNVREIEQAFADLPQSSRSVLVSSTDALFFVQREQIATLAIRHGLPAIFDARVYTRAGGLMSYAGDETDMILQYTGYIGRVLKGARPEDLPVAQPTKFALTINLKTARALGLSVPPELLATADEVIE